MPGSSCWVPLPTGAPSRLAPVTLKGLRTDTVVRLVPGSTPGIRLATTSGRPGSMRLNSVWLNAHANEHRGEWVALRDDHFVDSDRDLVALEERLPDDPAISLVRIPTE